MPRTRNTQDYEQAVRELIGPRLKAARGTAGLSQTQLVENICETLTVKLSPPPPGLPGLPPLAAKMEAAPSAVGATGPLSVHAARSSSPETRANLRVSMRHPSLWMIGAARWTAVVAPGCHP